MAANIRKIAIRASYFPLKIGIFWDKIIGGWNTNNCYQSLLTNCKLFSLNNRHSPHSLASVKDMYVEMAFQLNLYQHLLISAALCVLLLSSAKKERLPTRLFMPTLSRKLTRLLLISLQGVTHLTCRKHRTLCRALLCLPSGQDLTTFATSAATVPAARHLLDQPSTISPRLPRQMPTVLISTIIRPQHECALALGFVCIFHLYSFPRHAR